MRTRVLSFVLVVLTLLSLILPQAAASALPTRQTLLDALEQWAQLRGFAGDGALVLPDSVAVIDEEAFEGVAASAVVLPQASVTIGERAFANDAQLKWIYLFDEVLDIAQDAFAGSDDLTIYGKLGGLADELAQRFGFRVLDVALFEHILSPRSDAVQDDLAAKRSDASGGEPVATTGLRARREAETRNWRLDFP